MCASGKRGRLPSPLWGGVGGGGRRLGEWSCVAAPPPPPPLPQPAAGLPASGRSKSAQTPPGRGLGGGGSRPSTWAEEEHEGGEKENIGGGIGKAARRPLYVLHQARAEEHADR